MAMMMTMKSSSPIMPAVPCHPVPPSPSLCLRSLASRASCTSCSQRSYMAAPRRNEGSMKGGNTLRNSQYGCCASAKRHNAPGRTAKNQRRKAMAHFCTRLPSTEGKSHPRTKGYANQQNPSAWMYQSAPFTGKVFSAMGKRKLGIVLSPSGKKGKMMENHALSPRSDGKTLRLRCMNSAMGENPCTHFAMVCRIRATSVVA
mmetsp:Transcript_67002/g.139643  ORF Transcript_67002/g.139643 Transcript_67002/m.139643 type:complete len:202 (-) Transcript_67002:391-996(-)